MKINAIGHLVKTNPIQIQSNPIKSNFRKSKMNITSLITKDYERNDIFAVPENKPNSNLVLSAACPERSRMGRMGQFPKVQNEYNLTYNKGL